MRSVGLFVVLIFLAVKGHSQMPEMIVQSWHDAPEGRAGVSFIVTKDRNYLVTYEQTGDFRIWDMNTKRLIRRISLDLKGSILLSDAINSYWSEPAISPDNRYLLTQSEPPVFSFYLWNTDNGQVAYTFPKNAYGDSTFYNLAIFANEPNTLLMHGFNVVKRNYEVSFVNFIRNTTRTFTYNRPLRIGRKPPKYNDAEWMFCRIATSANGRVALGTTDGCVYLFNVSKLKENNPVVLQPVKQFIVDSFYINNLCFSKDGSKLIAGTKAGAKVWDIDKEKLIHSYKYQYHDIKAWNIRTYSGEMSENCSCIFSDKLEGDVTVAYLTDPLTGSVLKSQKMTGHTGYSMPYKTFSSWVSEQLDLQIGLTDDGFEKRTFKALVLDSIEFCKVKLNQVTNALLDEQNNELIIGKVYNDAFFFNLATGKIENLRKFIYTADTAAEGRIAMGGNQHFSENINTYLSADGKYLLTVDNDVPFWHQKSAMVWDRQKREVLTVIKDISSYAHNVESILSVRSEGEKWIRHFVKKQSFSARYIYEDRKDRYKADLTPISIIDNKTGKIIRVIYPYEERNLTDDKGKIVAHVAISRSGENLFAGMQNGDILMYQVTTGKLIRKFNKRGTEEGMPSPKSYVPVQCILEDQAGKYLYVARDANNLQAYVAKYNVVTGELVKVFGPHNGRVISINIYGAAGLVITTAIDGKTRFWGDGGDLKVTMLTKGNEYIVYTPDGYYMSSKKGTSITHYVHGKKVYLFEQFDLKLNRPDKVLERIGIASPEVISNYRKAYEKRLEKAGMKGSVVENEFMLNAPSVKIDRADNAYKVANRELPITVSCADALFPIKNIVVSVNGVPLYGKIELEVAVNNSREVKRDIAIQLSSGINIVEVSAVNQQGVESLRESFQVEYINPAKKRVLHLVTVGVSKYLLSKMNLDYAAKDADDLSSFFKTNAKGFTEIKEYRFRDKEAVAERLLRLKKELEQTAIDDRVLVFYAGHGLFDAKLEYYLATYNINFANPSDKGLLFKDFEKILENIPAREKIMFIDACHSGEIEKSEIAYSIKTKTEFGEQLMRSVGDKTVRNKKVGLDNSFELMKEIFSDVVRRGGTSVIAAARGGEYAMESGKLSNGIFTYCLLNALKGGDADRNGDRQLTLSELQWYLNYKVPALTAGRQQPVSRTENLVNDFVIYGLK